MSLRRTLVLLQITVVAVGLVVFGVTSYQLYRNSELQRLRQSLSSDTPALISALCNSYGGQAADGSTAGLCPQFGPDGFGDGHPDGGGADQAPAGAGGPDGTASAAGPAAAPSAGGPASTAGRAVLTAATCDRGTNSLSGFNLPPGSFIELRLTTGETYRLQVPFLSASGTSTGACPEPSLPSRLRSTSAPAGYTFTASAVDGPGPFLVQVTPAASSADLFGQGGQPGALGSTTTIPAGVDGALLVVAEPMTGVTASLHNLLVLDVTIGAILLVVLAVGTLLVIRRSLRPLERMAATSRGIAGGDLAQRVPAGSGRSEVNQLGQALNAMLGRIEAAFAERDATEQRLRQFLADASHELRTPLTSIRGYAELWRLGARRDPPSSTGTGTAGGPPGGDGRALGAEALDAATAMGRIEEHARRMGDMIEELLLLARLDETRAVGRDPVDLVVLAAEACDDAAALDPGRPISLDAPHDVVVIGDRAHLRRAVVNLTTNAVRHTPVGSRVEVAVRSAGGVGEIIVRDHGPGLPTDGLAHAFDRFWQADASRATGGSGLGLAIVAGVAAEHGGAATAANAPDGGAVFTLRLPLPRPEPLADPAPVPAGASVPAEAGPPERPR